MKSLIVVVVVLVPFSAFAQAIVRPGATFGARAVGMGGAQNAIAEESQAFTHNVAGLSQVNDWFAQYILEFIAPSFEFKNRDSDDQIFFTPGRSKAFRLNDKLVVGYASYPPLGLGVAFEQRLGRKAEFMLLNLTLAASYELTDKLAVGLGADIGYARIKYRYQGIKFFLDDTDVEGTGYALRAGMLWKPAPKLSLGLSYLSSMEVELESEVNLADLRRILSGSPGSIVYPERWDIGVAYQPNDRWLFAFDVDYYDFSKSHDIALDLKQLKNPREEINWQNSLEVNFGVEHRLNNHWTLRSGISWKQYAVSHNFSGLFEEGSDAWSVGIGVGYNRKNWALDVAYSRGWGSRMVGESWRKSAPGDYRAEVDVLSATFTRRF